MISRDVRPATLDPLQRCMYVGLRRVPLRRGERRLLAMAVIAALAFMLGAVCGCNQSTLVYGCPSPSPDRTPLVAGAPS